jgi:hypothetical protein
MMKSTGAKWPMMVNEPKLLGEIYGVRYEMTSATERDIVKAKCMIKKIVPMNEFFCLLSEPPSGELL